VLSAAFVMYGAREADHQLDSRAAPDAAASIARRAKEDVHERVIVAEGGT
jgi:hypothetical protein